jgi:hypothetical protein
MLKGEGDRVQVPTGVVKQAEINRRVAALEQELKPDVESIRYNIDVDWSGDSAIFFRIVLSDQASAENRLREVTSRVTHRLFDELPPPDLGLLPYFSFRSHSEQAVLRDEDWS